MKKTAITAATLALVAGTLNPLSAFAQNRDDDDKKKGRTTPLPIVAGNCRARDRHLPSPPPSMGTITSTTTSGNGNLYGDPVQSPGQQRHLRPRARKSAIDRPR